MDNHVGGKLQFRRTIAAITAACFLSLGLQAPAQAAVIGTHEFLVETGRAADIQAVQAVLDRAEVREQLVTLGVDPGQAAARVAALSDAELAAMADQLEDLPAGGDALAVIGVVFLVLLILELVGVIDIFKKT